MGALTEHTPKPMLLLNGRPVLEYIIDELPDQVNEVVIIIGYLGGVIQKHFGDLYQGRRILYVEQQELNGTAGALWAAKHVLKDRFLVMNGDDMCTASDILSCASSPDWAILVQELSEIGSAGKVLTDAEGNVTDILEKERHTGGPGMANTANFFLLDTRVFSYPLVLRPDSATEFGLPQTIVQAAGEIPIHPIEAHEIIRLTDPGDLKKAEELLVSRRS